MVEFALVLPVLLLLLLGMMQFGLALNYWIDSTHLTREAARYATVNRNPGPLGSLQDSILAQADTAQLRDEAVVCISYPPNEEAGPANGSVGEVGDPVRARMSIDLDLLPFLSDALEHRDGSNLGQCNDAPGGAAGRHPGGVHGMSRSGRSGRPPATAGERSSCSWR